MTFIIRGFKPHEYDMVRVWGNSEHFNRGTYDFEAYATLDKNTFWIGELDGQPIASIAIAEYSETFAYVGLYYVKPQHRGKGYGMQIWNKAFENVKAPNIGLECGTSKAEKTYETQGFKTYHKTYLYNTGGTGKPYVTEFLVDCRNIDFNRLAEYDQQHFVGQRKAFLQKWINQPESQATAYVRNGKIEGYGVVRVSDEGHRIGPLFADSSEVAQQIFKGLIGSVQEGKGIRLDVPTENQEGKKLANKFNMNKHWTCMRMYTKEQPFKKLDNIYGVTSLQLG